MTEHTAIAIVDESNPLCSQEATAVSGGSPEGGHAMGECVAAERSRMVDKDQRRGPHRCGLVDAHVEV
jgi:hypothetical protein